MAVPAEKRSVPSATDGDSKAVLKASNANELFIAIVSPAGAGGGTAADALKGLLEEARADRDPYAVEIVKASDVIRDWASANGLGLPAKDARKTLEAMTAMQELGDRMRETTRDNAAVARGVMRRIRDLRAQATRSAVTDGGPVRPDGAPRAYIIDSLRHPAEVRLLRRVYQDAFALVGVVCDPETRLKRLKEDLFVPKDRTKPEVEQRVRAFMDRDADDDARKHGQHVVDTFHQADFFVDNSVTVEDLERTEMNEPLNRLVRLLTVAKIERPTIAETAMHHAYSAMLRSACLSRQVGAALVDPNGNIVATGTNEVPSAGGGVYGEGFRHPPGSDDRCAFRETPYCSSNRQQNEIIEELLKDYPEFKRGKSTQDAIAALRKTRIGGLIEFSRAVHAEMDAILSAARAGISPIGCRLFVTTFPCHYCARHIVSAGIHEVQYIEPYPKSRALTLHEDSITTDVRDWVRPIAEGNREMAEDRPVTPKEKADGGRVLFRPFVGVAPRMYGRAFLKDRNYKDKITGDFQMGSPEWGGPWDLSMVSYTQLEAELSKAY